MLFRSNGGGPALVAPAKARVPEKDGMRRHGDLFRHIASQGNLIAAYHLARRGKSRLPAVRAFRKNAGERLRAIRESLLHKTFTTAKYHAKTVFEPKKRTIYVLPFAPDRIVQHALMRVVAPLWQAMFIPDSYACIAGKGLHPGSARTMEFVRRNRYCLKCDIHKFYQSVNHDILYSIIRKKIKCKDTLWLIENIIYSYPGGQNIPIGNLSSQWFGNLYLNELDRFVKDSLKIRDYIRYCDDFCFFHNDKGRLNEVARAIQDFCEERLRLTFSKCSLFPVSAGVDFLGYRHFPDYILLRKSTAKRVMRRLRFLPGQIDGGWVSLETARGQLASAFGWMKHANTHNLALHSRVRELMQMVETRIKETAA